MPLINENLNAQGAESFNQQGFNQTAQGANMNQAQKGLITLPPAIMQIISWIPIGLEMLTGQKIPATGILADILQGIQQLQFQVSQVSTQQQQLYARLESLENNASSQLNSLSQQLTNANHNFRLIANETKRHLELSNQPKELENN